jgi:Permease family
MRGVAVPLILRALKMSPKDVAFLISADLFACGLATLVQCIGFPGVGIRLPGDQRTAVAVILRSVEPGLLRFRLHQRPDAARACHLHARWDANSHATA